MTDCTSIIYDAAQTPGCVSHAVFPHSLQKVTSAIFPEVLSRNRLWAASRSLRCSFRLLGLLQHQLRTEIGGHTPVRTSEPGGGQMRAAFSASFFTSAPSSIWDCETVAKKRCRGVVGSATSLISSLFSDHLHITPQYPGPHPTLICQGEKDWHMHCFQLLHSVHLEFIS